MKQSIVSVFGLSAFFTTFAVANSATINEMLARDAQNTVSQQLGVSITGIPSCAAACAKALPSGCLGNPRCICNHAQWMNNVTCCVASPCPASDITLTQQFAGQLCKFVGQSLPSNPSCSLPSAVSVPATNWVYQGCYSEDTNYNRALNTTFYIDTNQMTPDSCAKFCGAKGLKYAGVEYGQECWCGNNIQLVNGATKLKEEQCTMPCKGNTKKICGGPAVLSIYRAP